MRILFALLFSFSAFASSPYFEIDVLDQDSGRGVPLVELETVDHVKYVTDSAGRIALNEPGLSGRETFFFVRSHGYEFSKDGFGMNGTRLKVSPGGRATVRIKRLNIAERLYRITGEGIYRDSVLLDYKPPIAKPLLNGQVMGQDSIQRVVYRGKIHWFWGDTLRVSYPLGNFRMSGAVSDLPDQGGLDPSLGIDLNYFTGADGFARGMFPIPPAGNLIWADGFMVFTNHAGEEQMLAHYIRLKGLGKNLGRGLAIYNDQSNAFEQLSTLNLNEPWRFPHGHPSRYSEGGTNYFYFGIAFPSVRVAADANAILNTNFYEAFSFFEAGTNTTKLNRDSTGKLIYRWTPDAPPATPSVESRLLKDGLIKPGEAHFSPVDVESGRTILIHSGTVCYNAWRQKWILIAVEQFGSSMLGEIWYSEANSPTGPWRKARKIVTHDKYSFYNPAQHPFFDQQNGRIIFFEGTYTAEFSGNSEKTPRYDYNQIMYRLDLDDKRLKSVQD